MQDYFSFKIYGSLDELKDLENEILKHLVKSSKLEVLNVFKQDIQQDLDTNEHYISYESNKNSCYQKLPFEFEDMMLELSNLFLAYKIIGTYKTNTETSIYTKEKGFVRIVKNKGELRWN